MKKKLLLLIAIILCLTTGCFKRDNMEGINIVTTYYPLEFVTNSLYGSNAIVNSIYPDGTNIYEYELSEKQLKDSSTKDLFVYLGLTSDRDLALNLLNRNKNLLIIDASYGMETTYGPEELWLNPSNLLMISQNIKNGLQEYIGSAYLNKEIDTKYEKLKLALSELDAEIKLTAENSSNKTIIVGNDVFKFLEKYGFTVISLDQDTANDKTLAVASNRLNNGNKYIFVLENDTENANVKLLEQTTRATVVTLKNLSNLTDEERNNNENYIKLMQENLQLLKNEIFN